MTELEKFSTECQVAAMADPGKSGIRTTVSFDFDRAIACNVSIKTLCSIANEKGLITIPPSGRTRSWTAIKPE